MFENFRESEWSAAGALQGDLEALEASVAQQFSDHDDDDDGECLTRVSSHSPYGVYAFINYIFR